MNAQGEHLEIGWNDIVIVDEANAVVVHDVFQNTLLDGTLFYEPCLSLCRDEPTAGDDRPGLYAINVGGVVMLHVG